MDTGGWASFDPRDYQSAQEIKLPFLLHRRMGKLLFCVSKMMDRRFHQKYEIQCFVHL